MIRYHNLGHLRERGFILAYYSRGIESIRARKAQHRQPEQEAEELHLQLQTQSRESELELGKPVNAQNPHPVM